MPVSGLQAAAVQSTFSELRRTGVSVLSTVAIQASSVQQARYLGMHFQAGKGFLPTFAWLWQQLCGVNALVRRQYWRLECSSSCGRDNCVHGLRSELHC